MDNLRLIQLVKEKDYLYNKQLNEFRMMDLKEATWEEIAEKLGFTKDEVKRRWASLRDRFTKELRMKILADQGKVTLTKDQWSLFDVMYFVKDYVKYKDYKVNSFPTIKYDDEDETQMEHSYVEIKSVDNNENTNDDYEFDEAAVPSKRLKMSNTDDNDEEECEQPVAETEVQTAVVERIEHNPRIPNAQVLGISRIVIHKLNNLDILLQNEAIENVIAYLSALERFQAGFTKTKPQIKF